MSKYIIELGEDANMVQVISVTQSGNAYIDSTVYVEYLEQLNSDYINENFGDLQDTAYQKGINDGSLDVKQRVEGAYQRGLDDAWEAAKKIVCDDELDWNTLLHIFNRGNFEGIFGDFSPSEAIEKLKAYEEKQKADDKIEVGDEVNWLGECFIVTRIFQPRNMKEQCDGIDDDGCVYHDVLMDDLEKTGRYFDIASILEAMKHD